MGKVYSQGADENQRGDSRKKPSSATLTFLSADLHEPHYKSFTRHKSRRLDALDVGVISFPAMKSIPILLATIACSCAFAAGPLTRVWTEVQGRKVEATFVRIEGDMIALRTRDGAVFAFKLGNLPPQEQAIARGATPFEPPSQADQIDHLVTKMLKAKGIKPNPPTSD